MGLLLNKEATPATPGSDKGHVFVDTTTESLAHIDDTGAVRILGQNAPTVITATSSGISNTETIVVGGLNNCRIKANQLKVGTTIRATLVGTCTSTAANASTWRFRMGTAGTTSDGVIGSAATSVAAASGTNIPFVCEMVLTVRTIGGTAALVGYVELRNTGVTGVSAVTVQTVILTPSTWDSTVDNWLSVTYVAAANTTTCTFQNAFIEIVKI